MRSLADGRYLLKQRLGEGGMGQVYRVYDTRLDVDRAVKLLRTVDLPDDIRDQISKRMLNEARAAQLVSERTHHVARVFDVGMRPGGEPFLVMEYLDGETLAHYLEKRQLPLNDAFDFAQQILHALDAAHGLGLIHRDLKPDNIMIVDRDGRPFIKLLDFGLVKLETPDFKTQTGLALGTLNYMAPEQLRGLAVDARTDLYAFGGIFFEMLAGIRSNPGKTQAELMGLLLDRGAVSITEHRPDLGPELASLIDSCLKIDPEQRPKTASFVQKMLESIHPSPKSQRLLPVQATVAMNEQLPSVSATLLPPSTSETQPDERPPNGAQSKTPVAMIIILLIAGLLAAYNMVQKGSETPKKNAVNQIEPVISQKKISSPQPEQMAVEPAIERASAVRALVDDPAVTIDKKNGHWTLSGPNGDAIFSALVLSLSMPEDSFQAAKKHWSNTDLRIKKRLAQGFVAYRPPINSTRLVLAKNQLDGLIADAPRKANLNRLAEIWIDKDIIVDRPGRCRKLRPGDLMERVHWTLRGYETGRCAGIECITTLRRLLKRTRAVAERLDLRFEVKRNDAETAQSKTVSISCRIGR